MQTCPEIASLLKRRMKSFVKGVLREHNERQNKNTRSKQENEIILVSTTAIVFVVIVTLEVTIIVMGNLFTILFSGLRDFV